MIGKFVKGRVAVFIDASNIFYSQRTLQWNIDYKKLIAYLKSECNLVGITIYFGKKREDKHQQKFLDMLEINGYEVKTREVNTLRLVMGKQS